MLNDLIHDPVPVPIGVGPRHFASERSDRGSFGVRFGLWFLLVAVATLGRLWQPGWNITPMAGVALAAGVVFSHPLVAASVPLTALAVSNLAMPSYGSFAMAAVVYAATAWPVLLGRWLPVGGLPGRRKGGALSEAAGRRELTGRVLPIVGGALASSLVFYGSTNFAHWCLTNDYPHTLAGLVSCYVAALPFYRWMPIGDVAWTLAIFGGLAVLERVTRGQVSTVSRTA